MAKDSRGIPYSIHGTEELLQQILIRLTVRKGKFLPDPELGSRLFLLSGASPARANSLAEEYVREALADMRDIQIEQVEAVFSAREDRFHLTVWISYLGETMEVRASL